MATTLVTAPSLEFLQLSPLACDAEFLRQWKQLEQESCCGNAFLSPEFVRSLAPHRLDETEVQILACRDTARRRLLGLGIFQHTSGTKTLPLPHLISWQDPHVYRSGLLLSNESQTQFFQSLVEFVHKTPNGLMGIEFTNLRVDSPWARELREVTASRGGSFRLIPETSCPAVILPELGVKGLEQNWSSSRRKSIRKNQRRLEAHGPVSFQILESSTDKAPALRRFLQLEQNSWKGEMGTALACRREDAGFARQLVWEAANSEFLAISELKAGTEVAATALNFVSGPELFAFKIAWNSRFENCSPGTLHEVALVEYLRQHRPGIIRIDSCAHSDSYLSGLWPHRITVGNGLLCTAKIARGAGKLVTKLQSLKRWASHQIAIDDASSSGESE
ncbi:GNAT family N-acetyltransferase [Rubinisphaera margarita]|uniref:GNAT family N-acetyltransferase n=1 Tax=Rubinisphaera margarita TaxID=2909586 RepID=UPI001EE8E680|nr:GNAT family N-acetyltransferase [Rubinisphaera margarita]MCG6154830.1 GNAT family N-acetyltransferase [Rubinisphaera margarita]